VRHWAAHHTRVRVELHQQRTASLFRRGWVLHRGWAAWRAAAAAAAATHATAGTRLTLRRRQRAAAEGAYT
jgi:hypothetical protein